MIAFAEKGLMDSVYSMERKLPVNSELYVSRAERNLKSKKLDSAEYYLNKANLLSSQAPAESRSRVLLSYGELYFYKKEYEKALKYYFQSLQVVKKIGLKKSERVIYQRIYENYKKQNDIERANEYLEKYTALNDSLNSVERNILDIPIRRITDENIENEKQKKNVFYYIMIGVILLSIILFAVLYKTNKSRQKQKDLLIMEKEKETEILKKQLSSSIDELVQLAKENSPEFFTRFNEIYPEFRRELLEISPRSKASEITFCAYLFLNFSTKDIAEFTFTSPRTVQTRKYNIRKKFNIPSNEDLYIWIQNIAGN
ncbi:tetratricopeptide repeat protein [Chryseobacterium sp. Marseille-Q8038]